VPGHTDVTVADKAFFDALVASDISTLERLLGPEFLMVGVADGAVTTRDAFLRFVASGDVRFAGIESFPAEAVVRHFGDTAVVVGRTAMAFQLPDGTEVRTGSRYTHVFVGEQGSWRLVSAQGTPLRDTP
jgi:ketosteroid isomerase-like protein